MPAVKSSRFKVLLAFFSIIIGIWSVYLFIVQTQDPHKLTFERRIRYNAQKNIQIPVRGKLLDRNGELLASSIDYYQIDLDCGSIENKAKRNKQNADSLLHLAAKLVAQHSSLRETDVFKRLKAAKGHSVYLTDSVKESDMQMLQEKMQKQDIPGLITSFSSTKRVYTKGSLAARVLGTVKKAEQTEGLFSFGQDLYQIRGLNGLEATFNEQLQGSYGWEKQLMDAKNDPIFALDSKKRPAKNGLNICLTLNNDFQEIVETRLREALEQYKGQNALAVFMDVKTGEILSMASVNANDLNGGWQTAQIRALPNLAVSYLFEPGSTLKPIPALLALEKGIFKSTDLIDCHTYQIGKRTIRDAHPFSVLSLREVITHSSNVGISKVAEKVGSTALYNRLIDMGFGNRTDSGIQGEAAGLFSKLSNWSGYSLHSISFGQEISVSALQLASCYTALANGGHVMRPLIWKEMRNDMDEVIYKNEPYVKRTVSTPAALDTLKTFLKDVVTAGTGTSVKISYIDIAGKTGTAEKKISGQAGYSKDKYVPVFAGFFPANNPKIAGVVVIDEPSYFYRFGSMSAGPTYKLIVEDLLSLPASELMIEAKQRAAAYVPMPDVMKLTLSQAEAKLKETGIQYYLANENEGTVVVNQYPKPDVQFDIHEKVCLVLDSKAVADSTFRGMNDQIMPELVGLTLRQAQKVARVKNLILVCDGYGVVYEQSIPKGEKTKIAQKCYLKAK